MNDVLSIHVLAHSLYLTTFLPDACSYWMWLGQELSIVLPWEPLYGGTRGPRISK